MIRSYPDDPRAPDALVKLARSMRLIGDKQKACVALDTLPKRYPNASGVTTSREADNVTSSWPSRQTSQSPSTGSAALLRGRFALQSRGEGTRSPSC